VQICSPNRVANTVTKTTGWATEELWFDSQQQQDIFLFSKACRPNLGST